METSEFEQLRTADPATGRRDATCGMVMGTDRCTHNTESEETMFERFTRSGRVAVEDARYEAVRRGMLLALL